MKICVLGGSGFLGSHVCDQLSLEGHQVIIFDRVDSPWKQDTQEMVIGDILDESLLETTISGCGAVYNFAGIADLDQALNQPIQTVKANVLGNVLVLEACRRAKIKRYLYASTVYVYSRHGSFYRCSKQSAEHFIEEYQKTYGLDYTILRYGSLYGPRSDECNGLWRIVKNALESGKVSYEGNAEAMREYIHVEDAAKASVASLSSEFCNQHLVLTGNEPIKVMDLLKMLAEMLNLSQEVNFIQGIHSGHYIRTPYSYQPKLGRKYIPTLHVDLGQGLLQLINEIKNQYFD